MSDNSERHSDETDRLMRKYCLIVAHISLAVSGITQVVSPTNGFLLLTSSMLIAIAITLAALADSRLVRTSFVHILQFLFLGTWPVSSLIYLMLTRGWRGILWWCVHAIGLFANLYVTFVLTLLATWTLRPSPP